MTIIELLERVRRIEVRTNRLVNDTMVGAYLSHFKGRGMDFEELREYIPGDDGSDHQESFQRRAPAMTTIISTVRACGTILSLLFLCSCTTKPHLSDITAATELPREVSINKDAGCGSFLYVMLRMEDGEEFPFMVDTGSSATVVDQTIQQKLGKRLGTGTGFGWEGSHKVDAYAAPKFYLGDARLLMGDKVWAGGSRILGMDCLKHYCVQIDFAAGKMRILKPDQVSAGELGKAYPLIFKGNIPYIHHSGLLGGANTNLMIDMGCRTDGLAGKDTIKGLVQFLPECIWDGQTYSNLVVAAVGQANVLGLNFFARHLVTLDFPKRMMYLKQTTISFLPGDNSIKISNDEIEAPVEFLESLQAKGQLSGLTKNDRVAICLEDYSNFDFQPAATNKVAYVRSYFNSHHKSATFGVSKEDDSSICHYLIARASQDSPWKLQKAWKSDPVGKTIEEFSTP